MNNQIGNFSDFAKPVLQKDNIGASRPKVKVISVQVLSCVDRDKEGK